MTGRSRRAVRRHERIRPGIQVPGGGGGPEFGDEEPVFGGGDTSLFVEDWGSYANAGELTSGAGDFTYTARLPGLMSIQSGAPLPPGGTQKVRFAYAAEGQDILLDCELDPPDSGAGDAVVWQYYYRQLGVTPATVHVGKMSIIHRAFGQRLLQHMSTSPPYPNAEIGAVADPDSIALPHWLNGDPYTPTNPVTTQGGYNATPTWNQDDLSLPGGFGYAYKPFLGLDLLGTYQDLFADALWHRLTSLFVRGPSYGRDRILTWCDGELTGDYDGDDALGGVEGKVYVTDGGAIMENLNIGGPANETGNAVNSVEWGPMRAWRPAGT